MSSSPKRIQLFIDHFFRRDIEMARRQRAIEEARLRSEIEEKHRRERLSQQEALGKAERERHRADALFALGRVEAVLEGLRSDAIVMRWKESLLSKYLGRISDARVAVSKGYFDRPHKLLAEIEAEKDRWVEEANAAQLKADERDYITESIESALGDMGFFVLSPPRLEHAEDPHSARIFQAVAASGRAIGVSVPIGGPTWYDTAGYPMRTEPAAGGDPAATCPEAERVLGQLHEFLEAGYGIRGGELEWDGKPEPDRSELAARELPTNESSKDLLR